MILTSQISKIDQVDFLKFQKSPKGDFDGSGRGRGWLSDTQKSRSTPQVTSFELILPFWDINFTCVILLFDFSILAFDFAPSKTRNRANSKNALHAHFFESKYVLHGCISTSSKCGSTRPRFRKRNVTYTATFRTLRNLGVHVPDFENEICPTRSHFVTFEI